MEGRERERKMLMIRSSSALAGMRESKAQGLERVVSLLS